MGWSEAHTQLVSIVEGTTVTTKKQGAGDKFRHQPASSADLPAATRGFRFEVVSVSTRQLIRLGGSWEVAEVDLVIDYEDSLTPTEMDKVQMADRAAVLVRLLAGRTMWGSQATTTIIKVGHNGNELIAPTRFEQDGAARRTRTRLVVDFENA